MCADEFQESVSLAMRFMHHKSVSLSECKQAIAVRNGCALCMISSWSWSASSSSSLPLLHNNSYKINNQMHSKPFSENNGYALHGGSPKLMMMMHVVRRGYVNESERVFYMRRNMQKKMTTCVSYSGLQAAYIKNCGLGVESYQMVEGISTMNDDFFPWDDLLREYAKKKMMIEARQLFDIMPERSMVSWHVVIEGYIKIGNMREAQTLFQSSPKEGTVWESMMYGYALRGMMRQIHKIINNECPELFVMRNPATRRDMLMWHMLIAGLCRGGRCDEALIDIFLGRMTKSLWGDDVASRNLLIEGLLYNNTLYTSEIEKKIFGRMDSHVDKNAMSWNLMFAAEKRYVGKDVAEKRFRKIPAAVRNSHSWNLVMAVQGSDDVICVNMEKAASIFHLHMPEEEQNVASWNALIYACLQNENALVDEARLCFDYIKEIRNPHSWGLMIAGYLRNGMFDDAENMFFDNKIRMEDDLHSWVLMILWFVKDKKTVDQGRRFLVNNVPKRPLSFYSIARACMKHGLRQEAKLVLESMQAALGTALNMHQVTRFMVNSLKERCGPNLLVHYDPVRDKGDLQLFGLKGGKFVRGSELVYNKYETHSSSDAFMQILDSEVDANGDCSPVFLKGSWDCCGALQV